MTEWWYYEKKKLNRYLDEIQEIRYYEPKKLLKLSRQLIAEGKKDKDEIACAYGEYYQLEAFFRFGKLDDEMLKKSIRALQLAKRNRLSEMECRCYNMLGIFLLNQGDMLAAMEYYQMGMDIAVKHRYSVLIRVLTNNLGDIYLQMKDYRKALYYLKKCYQMSVDLVEKQNKSGKILIQMSNLNISLLNIADAYHRLGDYEESLRYISMLTEDESLKGNVYYRGSVNAIYALNYGRLGRIKEAWRYIEEILVMAETGLGKLESVKDYLYVTEMLLDCNETEYAKKLLDSVSVIVKELSLANLWCDYYTLYIRYRKMCGTGEQLLEAYEKFFEYKTLRERQEEQQRLQAIENRQALDRAKKRQSRMEERNRRLKRLSEHDALTGLFNRYALNDECDKYFRRALESKNTLGIIVLDVDYFKQYNDSYGHLDGDRCLVCVSEVLKEAVGEDGIIARYGGDEFFILFCGKNDSEILKISHSINEKMKKKKYSHRASLISDYITVSQGIINAVPEETHTIFDFIHLADNALYKAKEERRGSVGVYDNKGGYHIYNHQKMVEATKQK